MSINIKYGDPIYMVYWYNQDSLYQTSPKLTGIYASIDEAIKRQQEVCGKGWKKSAYDNMITNDHMIVHIETHKFGKIQSKFPI